MQLRRIHKERHYGERFNDATVVDIQLVGGIAHRTALLSLWKYLRHCMRTADPLWLF